MSGLIKQDVFFSSLVSAEGKKQNSVKKTPFRSPLSVDFFVDLFPLPLLFSFPPVTCGS